MAMNGKMIEPIPAGAKAAFRELRASVEAALFNEGAQLQRTEDIMAMWDALALARCLRELAGGECWDEDEEDGEANATDGPYEAMEWWGKLTDMERADRRLDLLKSQVTAHHRMNGFRMEVTGIKHHIDSDVIHKWIRWIIQSMSLADLMRHQIASILRAERTLDGVCRVKLDKNKLPYNAATKLLRGELEQEDLARILTGQKTGDLWNATVELARYRRAAWQRKNERNMEAQANG